MGEWFKPNEPATACQTNPSSSSVIVAMFMVSIGLLCTNTACLLASVHTHKYTFTNALTKKYRYSCSTYDYSLVLCPYFTITATPILNLSLVLSLLTFLILMDLSLPSLAPKVHHILFILPHTLLFSHLTHSHNLPPFHIPPTRISLETSTHSHVHW